MFVLVLTLIVFSNVLSGSAAAKVRGYYWKDFDGEIPEDAVAAGVDELGNDIYIAQIYSDNGLYPASIVAGSNIAITTNSTKIIISDRDIKILCSVRQQKFKWIRAKKANESKCRLVKVGWESDHFLNVGRIKREGGNIVGTSWKDKKGLWIVDNGEIVHKKSYEVLTYCKKQ